MVRGPCGRRRRRLAPFALSDHNGGCLMKTWHWFAIAGALVAGYWYFFVRSAAVVATAASTAPYSGPSNQLVPTVDPSLAAGYAIDQQAWNDTHPQTVVVQGADAVALNAEFGTGNIYAADSMGFLWPGEDASSLTQAVPQSSYPGWWRTVDGGWLNPGTGEWYDSSSSPPVQQLAADDPRSPDYVAPIVLPPPTDYGPSVPLVPTDTTWFIA